MKYLVEEISKIYSLKIDQFIIQALDDLEELYFDVDYWQTLRDYIRLNVAEKEFTNLTIMTEDTSQSEEECQKASNMDTDPREQSSSNGSKNQSTFDEEI